MTQAIAAFGVALKLGDGTPASSTNVTGATNATPIRITSASHGLQTGDVVTVAGVGGNTAANGTWVVTRISASQVDLRDSVGNGTYTSGGTIQKTESFTTIAEVTDIQDAGGSLRVEEVTAHDGPGWVERIPTVLDATSIRVSLNFVPDAATHDPTTGFLDDLENKTQRNFLFALPDAGLTTWHYPGYVSDFRLTAPVLGVLTGQLTITNTGQALLSAA